MVYTEYLSFFPFSLAPFDMCLFRNDDDDDDD